jgi:TonB family protein
VKRLTNGLQERLELIVEEKRRGGGIALAVGSSFILHGLLVFWFVRSYRGVPRVATSAPIARYVELMKNNPRDFTEAPGAKVERAPIHAPLSNANRQAAMPKPTGDQPTVRPGDGSSLYIPQRGAQPQQASRQQQQQRSASAAEQTAAAAPSGVASPPAVDDRTAFRVAPQGVTQANAGAINWRAAITDAAKVASLGSGDGVDLGKAGGERGFTAEAGPLSFETKWFDWGDYSQSMVSKIRVNWYNQMPQLVRTGMKGIATIRFTIQRDGRITDVEIVESSGVPPYDFAARKAIELSSPLNALPKDFPNSSERVVAMFFYNSEPPAR